MKKLYYRLLLTLIVLACALPFIIKGKDGRPLMSVSDLKMPDLTMPDVNMPGSDSVTRLRAVTDIPVSKGARGDTVTVYRWQDDQGIWHYSDGANPQGQSEALNINVNANITSMTKAAESDSSAGPATNAEALLDQPHPLLHAGEVLQEAKNVEKVLQQRYRRQEQLLSQ